MDYEAPEVGVGDEDVLSVLSSVLALSRRLRAQRIAGAATLAGISILGALYRAGPMASNRLAEAERLEPQSLTRLLADLERRGYVARERSDRDRREVQVSLTREGRKALLEELGRRRGWLEGAIATSLDEEERRSLFAAAQVMQKLARIESAPPVPA